MILLNTEVPTSGCEQISVSLVVISIIESLYSAILVSVIVAYMLNVNATFFKWEFKLKYLIQSSNTN